MENGRMHNVLNRGVPDKAVQYTVRCKAFSIPDNVLLLNGTQDYYLCLPIPNRTNINLEEHHRFQLRLQP